jgi:hypothetical protein
MSQVAVAEVLQALEAANDAYYRLVLLVGGPNSGKTAVLRAVADTLGVISINTGLALSERLLELTARQRALRLPEIFTDTIASGEQPVILDNTEILFDRSLQQDPLRLLQGIARNRQVLACWSGRIENGKLLYAEPGHSEYRQYPVEDFSVVVMNAC